MSAVVAGKNGNELRVVRIGVSGECVDGVRAFALALMLPVTISICIVVTVIIFLGDRFGGMFGQHAGVMACQCCAFVNR